LKAKILKSSNLLYIFACENHQIAILIEPQLFRANGKLLLTGEYFVLDGALALALPTRLGQRLSVRPLPTQSHRLYWSSVNVYEQEWFSGVFNTKNLTWETATDEATATRLQQILHAARTQNTDFLQNSYDISAITYLEFPNTWGLGSSSTLIHLVAQWAKINPFLLLEQSFGGSGYDVACAGVDMPIIYRRALPQPKYSSVPFFPTFHKNIYFVYLGKKQDSRTGIQHYRDTIQQKPELLHLITYLTHECITCDSLDNFNQLIAQHEFTVARTLQLQRAKDLYFQDFWGEVKSLGAWGGDFVLVTSERSAFKTQLYFMEKGFDVFFKYDELILRK
jgi:mevalonate kinase